MADITPVVAVDSGTDYVTIAVAGVAALSVLGLAYWAYKKYGSPKITEVKKTVTVNQPQQTSVQPQQSQQRAPAPVSAQTPAPTLDLNQLATNIANSAQAQPTANNTASSEAMSYLGKLTGQ